MNDEKILTIELTNDGDQLEIHGNEEGLRELMEIIAKLLKTPEKQDHNHLMTPSWAGYELTEEKQGETNTLINMATVYFWP